MPSNRNCSLSGVLFDWDGTLINSYRADTSAYLFMFRKMGISWGIAELEKHYSPNWYHVYRAARLPRRHWKEADRLWRAHYATHRPKLISGVRRVLSKIGSVHQLGLVTSGDRDRVTRQLREFRLTSLFTARICSGDTRHKKPHPQPLLAALRKMSLDPSECVYVGDAAQDIEMARRAGVRAIGVLGPFPTEKCLRAAKPDFLLSGLEDLPLVLRKFFC